uniref:nucleoside diphosphate phosphatase n=1 Tax=Phallusia mammillata TaxID=59560 RepID=A0A6F9DBX2_9ASCI|nr:ectonucleoside triphosphate diphosphohydrolase 5 [Phallusia mammillata]
MKISLGAKNSQDQSLLGMKSASVSNMVGYKSSYGYNYGPINKLCIIMRWRAGTCLFGALLLIVCMVKLYLASMTQEPRIDNFDANYFHQTVPDKIEPEYVFSIMIDAGSTGSRVHVYKFSSNSVSAAPTLVDELFEQVKPGLSSYAENPQEGAASIKTLLEIAKERVPQSQWASTPLSLKATAGLRLLPAEQAENLLDEVKKLFHQYQFVLDESPVSVMDGTDEGIYGWISVNFLLKRLGGSDANQFTVGCIDLGGGSMQITFAPHEIDTISNSKQSFLSDVSVFNSKIKLYTHSYLGFGLMSAREASMGGPNPENLISVTTACMPASYNGDWQNGATKYNIQGATGIDNTRYELCRAVTDKAISGKIDHPAEIKHQSFYVFSYFFDRAVTAKLIDPKEGGELQVKDYINTAKDVCTDNKFDAENPFFCMDLCILSSFLEVGFQFSPDTNLISRRTINDKETSWTLGATFFLNERK